MPQPAHDARDHDARHEAAHRADHERPGLCLEPKAGFEDAEPHAQRALEVKIGRELALKLHDTSLLLAKANYRAHDHGALVEAATKEHNRAKK